MRVGFYKIGIMEGKTQLWEMVNMAWGKLIPNSLAWGIGLYTRPHFDDPLAVSCMFLRRKSMTSDDVEPFWKG